MKRSFSLALSLPRPQSLGILNRIWRGGTPSYKKTEGNRKRETGREGERERGGGKEAEEGRDRQKLGMQAAYLAAAVVGVEALRRLFKYLWAPPAPLIPPGAEKRRVVVIGGGPGGATVAKSLEDVADVTLIDR